MSENLDILFSLLWDVPASCIPAYNRSCVQGLLPYAGHGEAQARFQLCWILNLFPCNLGLTQECLAAVDEAWLCIQTLQSFSTFHITLYWQEPAALKEMRCCSPYKASASDDPMKDAWNSSHAHVCLWVHDHPCSVDLYTSKVIMERIAVTKPEMEVHVPRLCMRATCLRLFFAALPEIPQDQRPKMLPFAKTQLAASLRAEQKLKTLTLAGTGKEEDCKKPPKKAASKPPAAKKAAAKKAAAKKATAKKASKISSYGEAMAAFQKKGKGWRHSAQHAAAMHVDTHKL